MNMMDYFKHGNSAESVKPTAHRDFRKALVSQLLQRAGSLENPATAAPRTPGRPQKRLRHIGSPANSVPAVPPEHVLQKLPPFVRGWDRAGNKWIKGKKKYQQSKCPRPECANRTRTYCSCARDALLCADCHMHHVYSIAGWKPSP